MEEYLESTKWWLGTRVKRNNEKIKQIEQGIRYWNDIRKDAERDLAALQERVKGAEQSLKNAKTNMSLAQSELREVNDENDAVKAAIKVLEKELDILK